MNLNDQFDEIARQKLEERAFPFQEEAWLEARRAIQAKQTRRIGAGWYWGGLAAIGVAAWLLWPVDSPEQVVESMQQGAAAQHEVTVDSEGQKEVAAEMKAATVPDNTDSQLQGGQRTEAAQTNGAQSSMHQAPAIEPQRSVVAKRSASAQQSEGTTMTATSPAATDNRPATPDARSESGQASSTTTSVSSAATGQGQATDAQPEFEEQLVSESEIAPSISSQSQSAAPSESSTSIENEGTSGVSDASTVESTSEQVPSLMTPNAPDTTEGSAEEHMRKAAAPTDSAMAATPEVPVAPPLVTPQSPWEISLLGGMFRSTSTYSGAGSEMWSIAPENSWGAGAELMHMGRNFGVGGGLHYGTYADRFSTPEVSNTTTTIDRFWYLANVDTTLLLITGGDSLSGYTGISVPATVQVIRSSYDTTSVTTLLRRTSERVNRTSYIEVPVLMDAHLVQGRWSIGVRGGPTLGLLTTRSGSIPQDGDAAYADLNEVTMRQYVFGWTARAYVRYRFNSAWSVGIEPSARGQLLDGLDDLGVKRRSSALGGMISLSYRLR